MHRRNILFVKLALIYFLLGGLVGLALLWTPGLLPGNPWRVHGHLMLVGFTSMMIFGIALHVLPRFSGRTLYSEKMADWQFWSVNVGLWLMSLGWLLDFPRLLVGGGGVLELLGFGLFGYNLARTMMGYQGVAAEGMEARLERRERPQ